MDTKKILSFLKEETKELEGTYIEYNETSIMLTVPSDETRFQNVKGYVNKIIREDKDRVKLSFMSKVCKVNDYPEIDYKALLEEHYKFEYSKIVIHNGYLQLFASETYDEATLRHVRRMFLEVAREADRLELELTGEDIH